MLESLNSGRNLKGGGQSNGIMGIEINTLHKRAGTVEGIESLPYSLLSMGRTVRKLFIGGLKNARFEHNHGQDHRPEGNYADNEIHVRTYDLAGGVEIYP